MQAGITDINRWKFSTLSSLCSVCKRQKAPKRQRLGYYKVATRSLHHHLSWDPPVIHCSFSQGWGGITGSICGSKAMYTRPLWGHIMKPSSIPPRPQGERLLLLGNPVVVRHGGRILSQILLLFMNCCSLERQSKAATPSATQKVHMLLLLSLASPTLTTQIDDNCHWFFQTVNGMNQVENNHCSIINN